jgi:hypothetical protein
MSSNTIRKDLTGKRFGRLVVLRLYCHGGNGKSVKWVCKCDCGKTVNIASSHLLNGSTQSCGCYHEEQFRKSTIKHHMSNTRLYNIWNRMIRRCECDTEKAFINYGARGISVCEEWHESKNFFDWALANGYDDSLTIDRINVNGNYEPSNCRWITKKEQAYNKRNSIMIEYQGETKCLAEWCKILGIKYGTAKDRYKGGLPLEKVFTKEKLKHGEIAKANTR